MDIRGLSPGIGGEKLTTHHYSTSRLLLHLYVIEIVLGIVGWIHLAWNKNNVGLLERGN
jgi:hypothetical protein